MFTILLDEKKVLPVAWRSYEWHVGEKFPITFSAVSIVTEIQVDGDELIKVMNLVHDTVPFQFSLNGGHKSPVQRWFGDHAKFICAALQMQYPN